VDYKNQKCTFLKRRNDGMKTLKLHCEKVIQLLNTTYSNQLNYSGVIKKIYDSVNEIISAKTNLDKSIDIDWDGLVRTFADETMDYTSPIIFELETIKKLVKEK